MFRIRPLVFLPPVCLCITICILTIRYFFSILVESHTLNGEKPVLKITRLQASKIDPNRDSSIINNVNNVHASSLNASSLPHTNVVNPDAHPSNESQLSNHVVINVASDASNGEKEVKY